MSHRAGWARRAASALLLAAAVGFLAHTAITHWSELRSFEWAVEPGRLALSVAAHVAVLAWGVYLWTLVLRRFAVPRTPFADLLKVWAYSNAARYIPGSVWQFLTAAKLSGDLGLSRVVAVTSMLVHVGFSLLSAAVVSVLVLPLEELTLAPGLAAALRWTVPVLALGAVHPRIIRGALRMIPRSLGGELLDWRGDWGDGLLLLALSVVSWVFYGGAYFLLVDSLVPIEASSLPVLTGVNALSFAIGYGVILAPGGIGVREAAMTLLLGPVIPLSVGAVVAVAARLWSIVAEVLLALCGTLLARRTGSPGAG